jgi:hypothetical protein
MATGTAILDVEIVLYQCLEEIAKKEAQTRNLNAEGAASLRSKLRRSKRQ